MPFHLLIILTQLFSLAAPQTQQPEFPREWMGKWKGQMTWYQGKQQQQQVAMQLHIQATDSVDQYSWRIIYGEGKDNRPYTLKAFDKKKGHWLVDEHNSIVLDLFQIGPKLTGSFTVDGNTIVNNYSLAGDSLLVEFYNIQEKPIAITGGRDSTIPKIKSYGMRSYQRAILKKM